MGPDVFGTRDAAHRLLTVEFSVFDEQFGRDWFTLLARLYRLLFGRTAVFARLPRGAFVRAVSQPSRSPYATIPERWRKRGADMRRDTYRVSYSDDWWCSARAACCTGTTGTRRMHEHLANHCLLFL